MIGGSGLDFGPGIQINPITGAIIPAGLKVDSLGAAQYSPGPGSGGVAAPFYTGNPLAGSPMPAPVAPPVQATPAVQGAAPFYQGDPTGVMPALGPTGALSGTPPAPVTPDQQAATAAAPVGAMAGTPPSPIGAALATPPAPPQAPPPAPKAPPQAAQSAPQGDVTPAPSAPGQPGADTSPYAGIATPWVPTNERLMAEQAAAKAGLPPEAFASWTSAIANESQWNPKEADGAAGEIGMGQVMPATGKDMGFTPEQLRDPQTNLLASATYYGQKWQQAHGNASAALTGYNTGDVTRTPGDYANRAIVRMNGQPAQVVDTAATPDNGGFLMGPGGMGGHDAFLQDILGRMNATMGDLKPIVVPQVTQSQQLMALASGLLSGRSFGQGLARGLQGVNELQMANRQGQVQQAQLNNQQTLAKAGLLSDQMRTALMMRPRMGYPVTLPDGTTAQTIMYADGSMGLQPLGNVKTMAQQRVDTANRRLALQENGTLPAATQQAKADVADQTALSEEGLKAEQALQHIEALRSAIQPNASIMGPGTFNALKRYAVDNGFHVGDSDVDTKSLLNSMLAQEKTKNVGLMKSAVGSRVTNIEAGMGAAQGVTPETAAAAANWILDMEAMKAKLDAIPYQEWSKNPDVIKGPDGVPHMQRWLNMRQNQIMQDQGVNPSGTTQSPLQYQGSGQFTVSTPSGGSVSVTRIN